MATNYEDKRLTDVKAEEKTELTNAENAINDRVDAVQQGFQQLQDEVDKTTAQQEKVQNELTDFAIKEIEQNKANAEKDYTKEQAGAYVDWQKQSNKYGANAEKMASNGLTNTGYSESSQVAMYNQYQNRVAVARESFTRITTEYENAITNARLQNSVALAEIAAKAQEQKLNYMMQSILKTDELLSELSTQKLQIQSLYQNKYTDVLAQINAEKDYALNERQVRLAEEKWKYEKEQLEKDNTSGGGGGGYTITKETGNVTTDDQTQIKKKQRNKTVKANALENVSKGNITTYENAVSYLKSLGISNLSVPLMDSKTWNKAKRTGELGSEFEGIYSYKQYLKIYLSWAIEEYM